MVTITALTRDSELASRAAGVNKRTAAEHAEAMKAGASFPPIVVFADAKGAQWLADGFHRCAAAELAGLAEIAADVREGSRKDALLYAASANGSHGLRRTNADKRRAVALVLGNFPKWSDRKIAEACGVDHKTVGAVRAARLTPEPEPEQGGEVPQSEPADADSDDAIVKRLMAAFEQLVAQWPATRRAELDDALLRLASEAGK